MGEVNTSLLIQCIVWACPESVTVWGRSEVDLGNRSDKFNAREERLFAESKWFELLTQRCWNNYVNSSDSDEPFESDAVTKNMVLYGSGDATFKVPL